MSHNSVTGDALISKPNSEEYRNNFDRIFRNNKMADDADRADERIENVICDGIENATIIAAGIPKGEPGECDYCGGNFTRLVDGACGRCRDLYRLGNYR